MNEQIKDGGAAFPSLDFMTPERVATNQPGMLLRDYFAAKALVHVYTLHEKQPDKVAEWAYQIADAMLAAREAKS
jgi:hypothetical protein